MNLPAKGTTDRMILDYVCTAKSRTAGKVCVAINHVNKNTVLRLIAALKRDELLREDGAGLTLTAKSKSLYLKEAMDIRSDYSMPLLSPKNIPSVLGMREGSNEYRNWPSKYN
jgi:hypothetical protein